MQQNAHFVIPHQPDLSLTAEAKNEWSEAIPGIIKGETLQFKTWEEKGYTYLYKRINNKDYAAGYRVYRTFFGSPVYKAWIYDITAETGRKPYGWAFE